VSFGMGPHSKRRSFPRKRESGPSTALSRRFVGWIPAFAGMTATCGAHVSQMTPVPQALEISSAQAALREPFQSRVYVLEVERLRIKILTHPIDDLVMLRMLGIAQSLQLCIIAVYPSTILCIPLDPSSLNWYTIGVGWWDSRTSVAGGAGAVCGRGRQLSRMPVRRASSCRNANGR